MGKALDLAGRRFGKLVGLEPTDKRRDAKIVWRFRCDCGKIHEAIGRNVSRGAAKTCGCGCVGPVTHGMRYSKTWVVWNEMLNRAHRDSRKTKHYRDRGITVCERWLRFENFFADMGERPEGLSLDRIDNNGNYEPSNCRWASWQTQANNTRRNRLEKHRGQTLTMAQWARELDIPYKVLQYKVSKFGSIGDAINSGGLKAWV